ncbi:MotE family protein [Aestuariibius sp. HNIBRBA575]|uniref:MotE family protein n=1 Tax=Aestuariibius sp. HNIBRBA575 TaxID=3233343 RepID=UPI0034A40E81
MFIVTGLLMMSGMLRVGSEASQAYARDSVDLPEAVEVSDSETGICEGGENLEGLITAFQTREERIRQREGQLEDRLHALTLAEQEIDEKLAQLTAAEQSLRDTIALADSAAENDIDRLTSVYENMKPAEASLLFEEMAPNFAAGFLGRMRPDAAASIMAGLEPSTAYAISVIVAGRNANVPTE